MCPGTSCSDPLSLTRSILKIRIIVLCPVVVELDELTCMKILITSRPSIYYSNNQSLFSPTSSFHPFFLHFFSLSFRKDCDPIQPTSAEIQGRNSSSLPTLYQDSVVTCCVKQFLPFYQKGDSQTWIKPLGNNPSDTGLGRVKYLIMRLSLLWNLKKATEK